MTQVSSLNDQNDGGGIKWRRNIGGSEFRQLVRWRGLVKVRQIQFGGACYTFAHIAMSKGKLKLSPVTQTAGFFLLSSLLCTEM